MTQEIEQKTRDKTSIRLDHDLQARADVLVPLVAAQPYAAAVGGVTRATVLRLAVARGLADLERELLGNDTKIILDAIGSRALCSERSGVVQYVDAPNVSTSRVEWSADRRSGFAVLHLPMHGELRVPFRIKRGSTNVTYDHRAATLDADV